jgi:two-component system NtrC family sensor kinase
MLDADEAARSGDAENELIPERRILDDEIGQIMRSRNATIRQLRRREAEIRQVNLDLIRKNEMLETAKRTIAAQDRLASLGMLSASVAHEINTPLAVLQGSIEKLMETIEDKHSQARLERMLRVTGRLRRMSASLVDFAKVPQLKNETVSLHALIEESWGLVAIDDKAGSVQFKNDVPNAQEIHGNSDRLIQLFVNLLRNALLAVQSGGYIGVHCAKTENGWISIFVDDNGPGIPADVLPHIFEAFVTSRLDARGTGLGLTVAEGIAHEHGGSINAENRPGGGARLEVKLPDVIA